MAVKESNNESLCSSKDTKSTLSHLCSRSCTWVGWLGWNPPPPTGGRLMCRARGCDLWCSVANIVNNSGGDNLLSANIWSRPLFIVTISDVNHAPHGLAGPFPHAHLVELEVMHHRLCTAGGQLPTQKLSLSASSHIPLCLSVSSHVYASVPVSRLFLSIMRSHIQFKNLVTCFSTSVHSLNRE